MVQIAQGAAPEYPRCTPGSVGPGFQPGDIVTRDGTDVQRVVSTDGTDTYEPQMIEVECIKEPLGWLREDGVTREPPWMRKGEREINLARRYEYAADAIDGDMTEISGALPAPAEQG